MHCHAIPTLPPRRATHEKPTKMFLPRPSHITALFLLITTPLSTTLSLPPSPHHPSNINLPNNPNFRLTIAAAVHDIHRLYPAACLARIECTTHHGPTLTPFGLTDLRLFFSNLSPQRPRHTTVLLSSKPSATAWGQWAPLQYISEPRPRTESGLGDILTSDILQTVRLLREAGQHGRFDSVDVVREEGMTEVWWVFQMSAHDEGWVWVGDESGQVVVEGNEDRRVSLE